MKKIIRIGQKRKPKLTTKEKILTSEIQAKVELIQALIPLGLMADLNCLHNPFLNLIRLCSGPGLPMHNKE